MFFADLKFVNSNRCVKILDVFSYASSHNTAPTSNLPSFEVY